MARRLGITSARRVLNNPLFVETVVIRREATGSRNEWGEYVAGAEQSTTYNASVEPLTASDAVEVRQIVPEANRITDTIRVFVATTDDNIAKSLRVGTNQTNADTIEYAGLDYIIVRVTDFARHGHLNIVAVRLEGQNDASST